MCGALELSNTAQGHAAHETKSPDEEKQTFSIKIPYSKAAFITECTYCKLVQFCL